MIVTNCWRHTRYSCWCVLGGRVFIRHHTVWADCQGRSWPGCATTHQCEYCGTWYHLDMSPHTTWTCHTASRSSALSGGSWRNNEPRGAGWFSVIGALTLLVGWLELGCPDKPVYCHFFSEVLFHKMWRNESEQSPGTCESASGGDVFAYLSYLYFSFFLLYASYLLFYFFFYLLPSRI